MSKLQSQKPATELPKLPPAGMDELGGDQLTSSNTPVEIAVMPAEPIMATTGPAIQDDIVDQRALMRDRYEVLTTAEKQIATLCKEARPKIKEMTEKHTAIILPIRNARKGVAGLYWDVGEVAVVLKDNISQVLGYGHWGHHLADNHYCERTISRAVAIFRGFPKREFCADLSLREAEDRLRDDSYTFSVESARTVAKHARAALSITLTSAEADAIKMLCLALRNGDTPVTPEVFRVFHDSLTSVGHRDRAMQCLAYLQMCVWEGTDVVDDATEESVSPRGETD